MLDASAHSGLNGSSGAASSHSPDVLERWARVRLGHEAVMLEDAREVLAQNRKGNLAHSQSNGLPVGESDVGTLNLGDTTIYQQPPPAAKMSTLGKALIGGAVAAGIAGPIGGLFALPSILEALKPAAPFVQPQQPAGTDTDTLFDLFVGPPKESQN